MAALLAVTALTGCGGRGGHHAPGGPTTTAVRIDDWRPPPPGAPGPQTFCGLVRSVYDHEALLPLVADNSLRRRYIQDYVATVPALEAAAPPEIAPAARTYFDSVGRILSALEAAGLDYKKVRPGTLTPLLLDPSIKAAGNQVLSYSQSVCHYTIGAT